MSPEISKTARASMGRVLKEVHIETAEEAIKAIRDNRAGDLFIGDMSRVDKLLTRYDESVQEIVRLQFELGSLGLRNEELQAEMKGLTEAAVNLTTAVANQISPDIIVNLKDSEIEPEITQEHEDLEHGGEG